MFRNQYDTDITTYSPQGRLHQIEYAMEAVKQGSAVVGVRSNRHVVLVTLKRATSELSANQKKLFKVDQHCGVAIAGLMADARVLTRYMRNVCMDHKFNFGSPMPVSRLVWDVADKNHDCTQNASKRPYGVGLLVAGYDSTGPHLFQTCPSGNYYEYYAMAIGARSQSAKTYLERAYAAFPVCTPNELIDHALTALCDSASSGKDMALTAKNTAIAVVGVNMDFHVIEGDDVQPFLDRQTAPMHPDPEWEGDDGEGAPPTTTDPPPVEGGDAPAAPMDQS